MLPLPGLQIYFDLLGLVVVALPLGALLLRIGERLAGRRYRLSVPERLLLAFYVSGASLFVLASIPVPWYGIGLVVGLFSVGAVGYFVLAFREEFRGVRAALQFAVSWPGVGLISLSLGLLAMEVAGAAPLVLGNMLDGSLHSLFVNLLLRNHTLPWTLSPYASVGVTYPQAAPVWMSVPVLLFGWPVVSAPVDLPPLFLAISAPAAYCLGGRLLTRPHATQSAAPALLCAAFFGLVTTWPRLWIGGSFDVAFAFGLFLLLLGWIANYARGRSEDWTTVALLGVLVGIEISLSLMLGVATLALLGGYLIAFRVRSVRGLARWGVRWGAVLAISAAFLSRSFAGIAAWFSYPGHVLTPIGSGPAAAVTTPVVLSTTVIDRELNPFDLYKYKVSPIPWLSVEIAILMAAGVSVCLAGAISPRVRELLRLDRSVILGIAVGSVAAFGVAALILVTQLVTGPAGALTVTNADEASAVLFVFYELLAVLPLLAALEYLIERRSSESPRPGPSPPPLGAKVPRSAFVVRSPPIAPVVLAVLVLAVPLASGLGASTVQLPSFITDHIEEFANISYGDVEALEWAGANLPTCSRVLIAPGSVGQYLPEFATLTVVYPMFPVSANLSYTLVVAALVAGNYSTAVHNRLVGLGITEVFVSGQNSVSYLPFQLGPLLASPDFEVLDRSGDVTILEFLPATTGSGCSP